MKQYRKSNKFNCRKNSDVNIQHRTTMSKIFKVVQSVVNELLSKKIVLKSFFLFLGMFVIKTVVAGILIIGNWGFSINSADLISGAGSPINPSFESSVNQVTIDVTDLHPFRGNWRIDVRKADMIWNSNFQLFIARTGDGSAHRMATISGGLTYQNITDIDQSFFNGVGKRSDIPIQLKLEGITIQIPIGAYSTTIIYTITEF